MNVSENPSEVRPVEGELDLHNSHPLVIGDEWLDQLDARMLAGVISMDLRGTKVTPRGLARLLERTSALQELNLEDLRLTSEVLAPIAASPVRKLNVAGNPIDDEGLRAFASPHLESLSLSKTRVGDAGLSKLGDNLPGLRTLGLSYLHGYRVGALTDKGIEPLLGIRALENLYLDKTNITDEALKTISRLGLLVLTIGKTRVTDEGLRHLRCPRLQHLGVHYTSLPEHLWTGISDVGLANLDLPTLQRLDVSHNSAIVGTGIPNMHLPALRELSLAENSITGPGLEAGNLANLILLRLGGTQISDGVLDYVNAAALQELDLFMGRITDAGLDRLLQPHFGRSVLFPALRRLGLSMTRTTKQGVGRLKQYYPDLAVVER